MQSEDITKGFLALVLTEAAHIVRQVGPLPAPHEDPLRAQRCISDAAHAFLSWASAKGLDAATVLSRPKPPPHVPVPDGEDGGL